MFGSAVSEPDIFFLPMVDWHARMQRTQHLARAMSRIGHRAFYLSPHLGREFPQPPLPRRKRVSVSILDERIAELHVGLTREPVYHHRLLEATENRALFDAWEQTIAAFNVHSAVQIVSLPVWTELACAIRERFGFPIVYDCHDLLRGFDRIAAPIVEAEHRLFSSADLVLFSSQWLADHCSAAYPGIAASAVIRNGVDYSHFDHLAADRNRQGKIIGYVGSLDHWFEADAVLHSAQLFPEWKFILIGRVESNSVEMLRRLPNVELLGEVPYAQIPQHMATFDVALIPFSATPLTLATNPIKLYEYFSLGLPTVSTRLPELECLGDLLYLADNTTEFAAQIGRAADENNPDLRLRRKEVARRESWSSRASAVSRAIGALCRPELDH